jgi:hypothetical protein
MKANQPDATRKITPTGQKGEIDDGLVVKK